MAVCERACSAECLVLALHLGCAAACCRPFEAHSNSSRVSRVSVFLPREQHTLYSPGKASIASEGCTCVARYQNSQALFDIYAFINSCFSSYLLDAGHSAAPIHPRWFLNDSSVELHHPVINSLVHTGSPGYVHNGPKALSQVSLFRVLLPIRLFSCDVSTASNNWQTNLQYFFFFFNRVIKSLFGQNDQDIIMFKQCVFKQCDTA